LTYVDPACPKSRPRNGNIRKSRKRKSALSFAVRAQAANVATNCEAKWTFYSRGLFGGERTRTGPPEPAWRFERGSTYEPQDAVVFHDGRLMPSRRYSVSCGPNLNKGALDRMAIFLGLGMLIRGW